MKGKKKLKVLFITRKYPPSVGGMETFSYQLIKNMGCDKEIIALGKSKNHLIWFLPYALIKSLLIIKPKKITNVHLCDGLLAPLGVIIKKFHNVKVSLTIHGLDITFKNKLYQKIIPKSVNKLDKIVCVSNNAMNECINHGIQKDKMKVIPNGVNPNDFRLDNSKKQIRSELSKLINYKIENKKVLLTVGRLVKRKGVAWFVENVFTKLDNNYIYLVVGDGPERDIIIEKILNYNLNNRVFLTGKVSERLVKICYNLSSVLIMPNIKVEDDIEGFGIVAIEAGSSGLPVIASNIEGIKDAVINKKTGYLVKEKNVNSFIKKIKAKPMSGSKVRKEVINRFDWRNIVKKYNKEILG